MVIDKADLKIDVNDLRNALCGFTVMDNVYIIYVYCNRNAACLTGNDKEMRLIGSLFAHHQEPLSLYHSYFSSKYTLLPHCHGNPPPPLIFNTKVAFKGNFPCKRHAEVLLGGQSNSFSVSS